MEITKGDFKKKNGSKIFFTSDTHFGDTKIIDYCKRPFNNVKEMDEALINNWNSVVPKDGIVFHLGDFASCGENKIQKIIEQLNGTIHLIKGNHDERYIVKHVRDAFKSIAYQRFVIIEKQQIYLNHYPFLCYAGTYYPEGNEIWQLFGHVHTGPMQTTGLDNDRMQHIFPTQYDVGVDNNNFTPVSFYDLKNIINLNKESK